MSNRAWMPLHIEKYLADTLHLSAAEHGAYMLLIMRYWKDGGLPNDERMIQRYSRLSVDQWAESRDVLAAFFDDGWRHKRIDEELAKADEIIEKRRSAAFGRHERSKSNAQAEQLQSNCSDTGVPPRTNKPSSSSFHSEDDTPPNPPSGEAGDLFGEVEAAMPRSPAYNQAKAERAFRRLTPEDQRALHSKALNFGPWWADEQVKRNRSMADSLRYAPPLDKWIIEGAWRSFEPPGGSAAPLPELAVLSRDDPRIPALEKARGKPFIFGDKGTVTLPKSELARGAA